VGRLLLWNFLNWWLYLRGISLGILLSVIPSSSVVISLIVRARVRVTVIITVLLCHKLCNKDISVLDHPLLLIIAPMELLNLTHSLIQCMIHSHSQPHLPSKSSSRVIVHLVIHMGF
jgi:hypothetical protein